MMFLSSGFEALRAAGRLFVMKIRRPM